jgi:hypothetical protein
MKAKQLLLTQLDELMINLTTAHPSWGASCARAHDVYGAYLKAAEGADAFETMMARLEVVAAAAGTPLALLAKLLETYRAAAAAEASAAAAAEVVEAVGEAMRADFSSGAGTAKAQLALMQRLMAAAPALGPPGSLVAVAPHAVDAAVAAHAVAPHAVDAAVAAHSAAGAGA